MEDIFTTIFNGIGAAFGFSWMAWVILFIFMFALVLILLQIDIGTTFVVLSLPFLLIAIYQVVVLPSWALGGVIIVVGFIFGVAMFRLLVK